jgi:hapalindole H/12-epi-hapalindole U/12-epi-fischerindole U synthase
MITRFWKKNSGVLLQCSQKEIVAALTLICLGFIFQTHSANAAVIALENAGFELPEQTNEPIPGAGFFDFDTPSGWRLYDPNKLIPENAGLGTSFTGGWKPSRAFFSTIPEGNQIGSIFLVPAGAGEVGLSQNTSVTIQPETIYTLSAAILNTPALPGAEIFGGFPGYRLELLAGDTVIASDNNTLVIDEGGFETATISYRSSIDDPFLGETLSIRLVNPNLNNGSGVNGGNGVEVNFDNVWLTASTVPESTSVLSLFFIGTIGTIFYFKRIKPNTRSNFVSRASAIKTS